MSWDFRIFRVLGKIIAWLLNDPDRPSAAKTAWPLLLLLISPYFGALAFVLLPTVILNRGVPARIAGILHHYSPVGLTDASMATLWTAILCVAIPGFYVFSSALHYWGRRNLLELSMGFQKALVRRVARLYRERVIGVSRMAPITQNAARRLMVGDARYIGRAYLSLAAALPAFVIALISFGILVWLVPWIVVSMLIVLVLFLPLQGIVAADGQRFSEGFLKEGAKYSAFLIGTFRAVSLLPFPQKLNPTAFGNIVTNETSDGFFHNFKERTRVGYMGEFSSHLAVAGMLLVLVLAFTLFPTRVTDFSPEKAILTVVAARYFFSGMNSITHAVVGLGNTYPYYRDYMDTVASPAARSSTAMEVHSPKRAKDASTGTKWTQAPLRVWPPSKLTGVVGLPGTDVWQELKQVRILFGDADERPGEFIRLDETPDDPRKLLNSKAVDLPALRERFPQLTQICKEIEKLQGGEPDNIGDSRRDMLLLHIAHALCAGNVRTVAIGQDGFRSLRQTERSAVCTALVSAEIKVLLVNDDGRPFIIPTPDSCIVIRSDKHANASVHETTLDQANDLAIGDELTALKMPAEEYLGVIAEAPRINWQAFSDLLQAEAGKEGRASVKMAAPLLLETFETLEGMGKGASGLDFARLHSGYAGLSAWWTQLQAQLEAVVQAGGEQAEQQDQISPSLEFLLGLGHVLCEQPKMVMFLHQDFRLLTLEEREMLLAAMRQAKMRVIVWKVDATPFESPMPERILHLRGDGQRFRSYTTSIGAVPVHVDAGSKSDATLHLATGKQLVKAKPQIGLIVNQPTMTWAEIGHLAQVARKSTTLFEGHATLIAPTLFDGTTSFPLIGREVQEIDIAGLQASFPALSAEWSALLPFVHAFGSFRQSVETLLADASPATRFWLTTALALSEESSLIFARERDLRMISQNARARLVASLDDQILVVWKDGLSVPFAHPQPKHVLLANNEEILAVVSAETGWDDLPRDIRSAIFRETFEISSPDSGTTLADETEE